MPCPLAEHALIPSFPLTPPLTPKHPASLSRDLPEEAPSPTLMHTLHQEQSSVLSVAADDQHIFSGSQGYDIYVWDRRSFSVKTTLRGHTGSVLALEIAREKNWLISSSGDSTVRVWCTSKLTPIYIINPYLDTDSGDLFCLSFSSRLQTVYFGCQNTSLQWFDFTTLTSASASCPSSPVGSVPNAGNGGITPVALTIKESDIRDRSKRNKFFAGGLASGQATPPRPGATGDVPKPLRVLQVEGANVIDSAHYGYVYSMALLPCALEGGREDGDGEKDRGRDDVVLVTGSGDETVKLWLCTSSGPSLVHTFEASAGAVLSLIARHDTVYAGCQDGHVKVFDLETKTLVRTIIAQEGVDILSLSMMGTDLYTCSANGQIQRWSAGFDCTACWHAHDGIVLSSIVTHCSQNDTWRLVTGANDNCIKLWQIDRPKRRRGSVPVKGQDESAESHSMHDTLLYALSKFVSIPSVSNDSSRREDCRQAAIWLKKCLTQLGAEASLLPTAENTNPLVLGTFHGSQTARPRPRILFYGHYDVISAPAAGWTSDPFVLTARDGYFYGRGTTDDKGPVLAAACAASSLLRQRLLEVDLVFLVEGEEERGSVGFAEAIRRYRAEIGQVDAILVSNSTWISEGRPCITYGMRGVVHCSVEISSERPDLHSGVDGGTVTEPMLDMVKLLATLSEDQRVLIPGFYDAVRPQTDEEMKLYGLLSTITGQPSASLSSRWREPSLSIHSLEVSGPGNATVIPAKVKAKVSLRIVPDQDLKSISRSLCNHIKASYDAIKSPNTLAMSIDNATNWWLGDINEPWFKALEGAIKDEWGVEPLRIREGGSIPSVPFLEKEFKCPTLHLPLGQSSDRAHLPNERISLDNLYRGKAVIERFLRAVSPQTDTI